jgi:membrane-associated phospholipid phosphatase
LKYLGGPWNVAAALLIGSAIFLIGVSRIYKGSHYPSDVLAGWLLGLISLGVVISLAF